MNTNQKKLKLVKEGIKASTLNKMTDSQVDVLFSKLQEQVTPVSEPAKTSYKIGNDGGDLPATPKGYNVKKNPDGTFMAMPNEEKEIEEEFKSKKQQKYFFSKCGDGKTKEQKKWCKMAEEFSKKTNFAKLPLKKKETKEGYQDMIGNALNKISSNKLSQITPSFSIGESEIEKEILRIVERHITPKMSKKDFIRTILESPEVLPKPGTKPAPTITPNPDFDPFDEPDPSDDPEARNPEVSPKPGTKPAPTITPNPDFDPFNDPDPSDDPEAKSDGFRFFMGQVKKNRMIK